MIPLALIPIFAALSAMQGANTLPRGVLMALHVAACALVAYLAGAGWYSLGFAVIAPAMFWLLLRGGWQAGEELDYMAGKYWASLWWVAAFHLPHLAVTLAVMGYGAYLGHWQAFVGAGFALAAYPLPLLALTRWNYEKTPKLMNTGKFWDVRRPTEIATGISGGVQSAAMLWVLLSMGVR